MLNHAFLLYTHGHLVRAYIPSSFLSFPCVLFFSVAFINAVFLANIQGGTPTNTGSHRPPRSASQRRRRSRTEQGVLGTGPCITLTARLCLSPAVAAAASTATMATIRARGCAPPLHGPTTSCRGALTVFTLMAYISRVTKLSPTMATIIISKVIQVYMYSTCVVCFSFCLRFNYPCLHLHNDCFHIYFFITF